MGKGDHMVLQKEHRVFSVPLHKTLKKGTLPILKIADVDCSRF